MKTPYRRPLALLLAAVLAAAPLCTSALAAGELEPVCDESYYATLDYYGGLMDASVVKSYQTNGNTELTDYGTYDEIIAKYLGEYYRLEIRGCAVGASTIWKQGRPVQCGPCRL